MTALIILGLVCAAVLYGIFFLIFKLIWLLFKRKRNLWPLLLAGAATAAFITLAAVATTHAVRTFVRPFNPIIEAARTQTAPVYGRRPYTDARYGFGLTLYNGTVMSEWIDWNNFSLLAGVDTNALLRNKAGQSGGPFAMFALLREVKDEDADAEKIMNDIVRQISQAQFQGRVETEEPAPDFIGGGAQAYFVSGTFYNSSVPEGMPFSLLVAAQGKTVYYVVGFGHTPDGEVTDTVRSFRFSGPPVRRPEAPAPIY